MLPNLAPVFTILLLSAICAHAQTDLDEGAGLYNGDAILTNSLAISMVFEQASLNPNASGSFYVPASRAMITSKNPSSVPVTPFPYTWRLNVSTVNLNGTSASYFSDDTEYNGLVNSVFELIVDDSDMAVYAGNTTLPGGQFQVTFEFIPALNVSLAGQDDPGDCSVALGTDCVNEILTALMKNDPLISAGTLAIDGPPSACAARLGTNGTGGWTSQPTIGVHDPANDFFDSIPANGCDSSGFCRGVAGYPADNPVPFMRVTNWTTPSTRTALSHVSYPSTGNLTPYYESLQQVWPIALLSLNEDEQPLWGSMACLRAKNVSAGSLSVPQGWSANSTNSTTTSGSAASGARGGNAAFRALASMAAAGLVAAVIQI